MNDTLPEEHEADARYMTWLLAISRMSDGVADFWVDVVDGRIVYALRATMHEPANDNGGG